LAFYFHILIILLVVPIIVYRDVLTESTSTMCGQNMGSFKFRLGGTCS